MRRELVYLSPRSTGDPLKAGPDSLQKALDLKRRLTDEVRNGLPSPDLLTRYWQAVYIADGMQAEFASVVPPCDWEEKPLRNLYEREGRLIYVPGVLTTPEGLVILQKMYPVLGGDITTRNGMPITQDRAGGGWIGIETCIEAPLRNGSDIDAREILGFLGLEGQRLSTYIVGAMDSFRLTGQYFDNRAEARLLDSRCADKFIYASFPDNDGPIRLNLASSGDHYPYVGTRTEMAKPQ
jgi:hypothetical protein